MSDTKLFPSDFQTDHFNLNETTNKMTLQDIFKPLNAEHICHTKLFVAHFNKIPNYFSLEDLDLKKTHKWFIKNYQDSIKDVYFNEMDLNDSKKIEFRNIFYFLFNDLIVYYDFNYEVIRFTFRNTDFNKIQNQKKYTSLNKFTFR